MPRSPSLARPKSRKTARRRNRRTRPCAEEPATDPAKQRRAATRARGVPKPAGDRQAIPEQPARNAATPASKGTGSRERFKGPNGAAGAGQREGARSGAHQQTNGRRCQGQAQQGQAAAGARKAHAGAAADHQPVQIQSAEKIQGKPVKEPPKFRLPQDAKVEKRTENRVILNIGNRTVIENNDYGRMAHDARDVRYETLSNGNTRQVVVRPNGVRVITIRNEYGDVVHRSRIGRDGQEITLIYAPESDRHDRASTAILPSTCRPSG